MKTTYRIFNKMRQQSKSPGNDTKDKSQFKQDEKPAKLSEIDCTPGFSSSACCNSEWAPSTAHTIREDIVLD